MTRRAYLGSDILVGPRVMGASALIPAAADEPGAGVDNLILSAGGDNLLLEAAPSTDVLLLA